ncbi:MAG: sensor histidine kinase [Eubacteriales bacterium]|nr:sensor histidine kinase [Eubacteriales bacterium]
MLFRKSKYRTKMVLSFLLIVLIPLALGLVFLYNSIVLLAENNARQALEQQMDRNVAMAEEHMAEIDHALYLLSTNITVCQFVADNISSTVDLVHRLTNEVLPLCSWFEASTSNYYDFVLFSDNPGIPETEIFHPIEKYCTEPWFMEMEDGLAHSFGSYLEKAHPYHNTRYRTSSHMVFTLYRKMLLPDSGRTGYFGINVSTHQLFSPVVSNQLADGSGTIVLDDDGEVLASHGVPLQASVMQAALNTGKDIRIDGRSYTLLSRHIDSLGISVLGVVPEETLNGMFAHSRFVFLSIALSSIFLVILLVNFLSNALINRINIMVGAVRQMQAGNYGIHIDVKGDDEIDELARSINSTSERINTLINTVHRGELLQKETELRALQAQINPHFLFNILETFKMMAEIDDDEKLADGLTALGHLMRYNVYQTTKPTPLADELQQLRSYVALQNMMLNNRLVISYDISDACMAVLVPRQILQPLLENSIKYTYYQREEKMALSITGRINQNVMRISVCDNGPGMSAADLCKLRDKIDSPVSDAASHGIGLWNVNMRLKLIYEGGRLELDSEIGKGFQVDLVIPTASTEERK